MGIRAVQAGALTSAIDRTLSPNYPDAIDYDRAAPFRALCDTWGEDPAWSPTATRSASRASTPGAGREEPRGAQQCLDAEAAGPLEPDRVAAIDALGLRA